ncbi:hypothetical protein ACFVVP_05075 [Streptomyces sp. NPDC058128]|uniref:hypothetical protein n=1 Tax=Streptomyces sp. NPDC058128 TaxID=3346352 RepID=UPI0036F095A8
MHIVEQLWGRGEVPYRDGLYRVGGGSRALWGGGPGVYHPDAGQPVPFLVGEPLDVAQVVAEYGTCEVDVWFKSPLPDGSGWVLGGGGGMGNVGHLARLGADRSLRWVALMESSNPFLGVRHDGTLAVFTNDWQNLLSLDLDDPLLR